MRNLGTRFGIGLVVALVAVTAALGGPADARAHHHGRHHHHHTGGEAGGAPAASTNSCVATPQTVAMTLAGAFSTSVSCHGLAPQEGIVIDSLLLRLNCGGLTIQGAVPPLTLTTDAGGGLAFNIAGFNCLAGNYSVQGVGVIDNLDFPVSLTF